MVVVGGKSLKYWLWALPNDSHKEILVTNMRVRTTFDNWASSSVREFLMISKHRQACLKGASESLLESTLPLSSMAAVPVINI